MFKKMFIPQSLCSYSFLPKYHTLPSPLSRHQQLLYPPGKGRQASVLSLFDYCSFIAPAGFGVFAHLGFGGFAHWENGFFAHPGLEVFAHLEIGVFF
jgi:hypothetical protein